MENDESVRKGRGRRRASWTFHLRRSGTTLFPLVATGMRSFLYSSGRNFSINTLTGVLSVTKPCLEKKIHFLVLPPETRNKPKSLRLPHLKYLLMRSSTSSTSMVFLFAWAENASRSSARRSKYLCSLRHGTQSAHGPRAFNNVHSIIKPLIVSAYMSLMTG